MRLLKTGQTLALSALLTTAAGCIDDKYDLSDIDTTSRFTVNDLTVPMNLDEIRLKSIIEIEEDSKLQIFTDAEGKQYYAVQETGTFTSDPVHVDEMTCSGPQVEPVTIAIDRIPATGGTGVAQSSASYDIKPSGRDFTYDISDIDASVHSVSAIGVRPMDIVLTLSVSGLSGHVRSMTFSDLIILMPKGLTATSDAGDYDPATGILSIGSLMTDSPEAKVKVTVTAIDMQANGSTLDYDTHSLAYVGEVEVASGVITVDAEGASQPAAIDFTTAYDFGDIYATTFSGEIDYRLSGVKISDVDLSDMPDFLAGEGTDIALVNPQIYLNINNPVGDDGLDCRTGLTLSAIRGGEVTGSFGIDNPFFPITHERGNGPYYYCLSPSAPAEPLPGYPAGELTHVAFTSLSDVLSGDGLPSAIGITLDDPCIPLQAVRDFALGQDIQGVDGTYDFFAPLSLKDGSTIIYTDTEDGWSDEDVDAITIEKFEVTALASTDLPLVVRLTAVVLDKNGNTIDADLSSAELPANAKDFPFTITLGEGQTVKNLDGIRFTAHVKADGATPLSPEQTIVLKKVRGKVSGNYTKEL